MYITNSDEVIPVLRTRLNDYLVIKGVKDTNEKKFLCFVHGEDTPSMCLNPKTFYQTAHCFGCGADVDIFAAASYLDSLPANGPEWMQETVPALAEMLEIPLQFGDPGPQEAERLRYFKLTQDIADILESEQYINTEYTESRNWTNDYETCGTIDEDELIGKLVERGWSSVELTTTMVVRGAKNSIFGTDKVTFTIRDARGRPVGFISRNLSEIGPKYINSPGNVIFEKRNTLLGLDKAIKPGRFNGLYIVEGPGDRAQLLRLGIKNVVATMGTAFTEEHVNILKMYGIKDVYFCLDWDNAGVLATHKIFQDVLRKAPGLSCYVIEPPEDMGESTDPDQYLFDKLDPKAFTDLPIVSAFGWVMKNISENESPEDICAKMVPLIAAETAAVKREILIDQLHNFTSISHHAIAADVSAIRDRAYEERKERLKSAVDKYKLEVDKDPENLLAAMSQHERDVVLIEQDYERDVIGTHYQLSRLDALQELKKPSEDGIDRTTFLTKHMNSFVDVLTGGMNLTVGTLIYLGGRANSGKTATGSAIAIDIAMNDPDTIVLCHYTDDPLNLIEPRLLTIISKMIDGNKKQKLAIGQAANPYRNIVDAEHSALYKKAALTLRDLISQEKLILIDSTDGATLGTLERYLKFIRRRHPQKKIFMFCDNTYNYLDFGWLERTERITRISDMQKTLTVKYRACMLATAEYRKNMPMDISKLKLPVNDDLADARALMYRSNAIVHVYNDLKDRGDHAEFFHVDPFNPSEPLPRLLLVFGKNKITAFDKTLFFDLDPVTVTLTPISVDNAKHDHQTWVKSEGTISNGRLIKTATEWDGDE